VRMPASAAERFALHQRASVDLQCCAHNCLF
jgi:hypothetical protein